MAAGLGTDTGPHLHPPAEFKLRRCAGSCRLLLFGAFPNLLLLFSSFAGDINNLQKSDSFLRESKVIPDIRFLSSAGQLFS